MSRACFVSDLHLFAHRSRGEKHLQAIRHKARESEHCVLGGDIFDFKWSTLPSTAATIEAALHWLHELAHHAPQCQFHFLLGNHDHHPDLVNQLPGLASDVRNFDWEEFYLRLGNAIFLHGDVADRKMTAARLERKRQRFRHHRRSRMQHRAYDVLVRTQMHSVVPRAIYPKRIVARRILNYLRDIGHGPEDGVRHVYFGHTHRAVNGYEHEGLAFHNCGAPIGRQRFRILELEIEGISEVRHSERRGPS